MVRQASRSHSAPTALAELIELANCISPRKNLPDLGDLWSAAGDDPQHLFASFKGMLDRDFAAKKYRRFRNFIGPILPHTFGIAADRYQFFSAARQVLRVIAGMRKNSQVLSLPGWEALSRVKINAEGRIELVLSPLLAKLLDVEAARIRQCPVCDHIFWAGRIDQPGCRKRCSHVLRTRRWREKYLKHYKQQRYRRAEQSHQTTKA